MLILIQANCGGKMYSLQYDDLMSYVQNSQYVKWRQSL